MEPTNTNHCEAGKTLTPFLACYIASIAVKKGPKKLKPLRVVRASFVL